MEPSVFFEIAFFIYVLWGVYEGIASYFEYYDPGFAIFVAATWPLLISVFLIREVSKWMVFQISDPELNGPFESVDPFKRRIGSEDTIDEKTL